jgi:ornithine--oxo-acid transaminase
LINCSTFGGNPLASAVAVASLKVIKDEGLVQRYANFYFEIQFYDLFFL